MMVCADGRQQRRVALPVVGGRIDDHALHRSRGIVAGLAGGGAAVAIRHHDAPAIGVEKDLRGIEAQAVRGLERPVDAIAIDLARPQAGDEHVPVVVGAIGGRVDPDHARWLRVVDAVEEQQLDPGRVLGEHAEVHPVGAGRRPERRAGALGSNPPDGIGLEIADRGIDGPSYGTGHGFAPRFSAAYSAIVRSLENLPE